MIRMTSTSSMMERVQFQPEASGSPSIESTLWNMLKMKETAQLKGHIIVSRKAINLSGSQAGASALGCRHEKSVKVQSQGYLICLGARESHLSAPPGGPSADDSAAQCSAPVSPARAGVRLGHDRFPRR